MNKAEIITQRSKSSLNSVQIVYDFGCWFHIEAYVNIPVIIGIHVFKEEFVILILSLPFGIHIVSKVIAEWNQNYIMWVELSLFTVLVQEKSCSCCNICFGYKNGIFAYFSINFWILTKPNNLPQGQKLRRSNKLLRNKYYSNFLENASIPAEIKLAANLIFKALILIKKLQKQTLGSGPH